jgi:hypothetical protein
VKIQTAFKIRFFSWNLGFVSLTTEDAIRWHIGQCEEAINRRDPQGMVDHTSSAARLGNRVLMVAKQEADNSEDPVYNAKINRAADGLQSGELLASPSEPLIFFLPGILPSLCLMIICTMHDCWTKVEHDKVGNKYFFPSNLAPLLFWVKFEVKGFDLPCTGARPRPDWDY